MFKRGLSILVFLIFIAAVVGAAIPQRINYEGRLTDSAGNPLTGFYNMRFSITSDSGGSSTIWGPEYHTSVTVTEGVFTVTLGNSTSMPISVFSDDTRYLKIEIANPSTSSNYEVLTPHTQLVAVGYAFKAAEADEALSVSNGSITAAKISTEAVTEAKLDSLDAPSDGEFLSWNNVQSRFEWKAGSGTGTVTQVDTGTGLSGGPITTTGTIAIDSTVATLTGTQTLSNKTFTRVQVDDASTYVDRDGSNNMTFTDAVTGTKTLAELAAGGGSGTVTSVDTGTGLTGGPITTTGTLSIDGSVVTTTGAQTLTNKTIDADNNTLSNIDNNEIKAAAAIAYSKLNLSNSVVSGDIAANTIAAVDMATNSVTASAIAADAVTEPKLDALDAPANAEVLSWNAGSSRFEWVSSGGTGTVTQVDTGTGLIGGPVTTTGTLSIDGSVVTTTGAQTLTNKTIDADNNTLSNIDNNEIKAAAGIVYSKLNLSNSIVAGDLTTDSVTSGAIAANTITAGDLAANAAVLTFAKQADARLTGNVDLKEGTNITLTQTGQTIEIVASGGSGSVTSVDSGAALSGGPITTAGTLDVEYDDVTIGLDGAGSLEVKDGGIGAAKLGTNSVTSSAIASDAVTEPKLDVLDSPVGGEVLSWNAGSSRFEWVSSGGTGTVTQVDTGTGLIGGPVTTTGTLSIDGSVVTTTGAQTLTNKTIDADNNTLSNIDNNEIKAAAGIVYSKLDLSNSIVAGDLTTNSVTSGAIADDTIVNADINSAAGIVYGKLNLSDSIVSGDIASNTIAAVDMGTNAVTSSAIASDAVTEPKLDVLDSPVGGEVLSWNAGSSRFEWISSGGTGTVTQVDTGTGLIGGPVTTTGTLSIDGSVVTTTGAQTLTNKTIDADNNTLSNIDNNEIKAAAGIEYSKLNLSNSIESGDLRANAAVLTFAEQGAARLTGDVDLKEGTNITLTQTGQTIEIVASGGSGSVTSVDSGPGLLGGPITTAGTLEVAYDNTSIDLNGSNSLEVKDGGIGAAKLGTDSVTSGAIANDTIVNADINSAAAIAYTKLNLSNSVVSGDIAANTIAAVDMGTNSVTTSAIADANVTAAKLASDAAVLTFAKQADARLTGNVDLKEGTNITLTQTGQTIEIVASGGSGSVTSVDSGAALSGGPITTAGTLDVEYDDVTIGLDGSGSLEVKDGGIGAAKLGTDSVTSSAIAADAVTEPKLDALDAPANAEVLSWNAGSSRFEWVSAGGTGTVTQVNSGTGLIGGPITTTGTLSIDGSVVTTTGAQTLTNKTIDADLNTLSNIDNGEIKAAAGIVYSKLDLSNSIVAGDLTVNSVTAGALAADAAVLTFASQEAARLTGNVDVKAGSNVTITQTGQTLEVAATTGGGDITSVTAGPGLLGGGTTGDVTLEVAYDNTSVGLNGTSSLEVKDSGITSAKIADNTITAADMGTNSVTTSAIADANVTAAKLASNAAVLSFASQEAARLTGNVDLKQGTNITLTQTGQTIEVASAGGSGTVTSVDSGLGLTGGPITTSGTLDVQYDDLTIGLDGSGSLEVKDAGISATKLATNAAVLTFASQEAARLTGNVDIKAGSNVIVTQTGQTVEVTSTAGGAPSDAIYLVGAANATLTAEKLFKSGTALVAKGGSTAVTFTTAFPDTNYAVILTPEDSNTASHVTLDTVAPKATTGFTILRDNTGSAASINVYWMAVQYNNP